MLSAKELVKEDIKVLGVDGGSKCSVALEWQIQSEDGGNSSY